MNVTKIPYPPAAANLNIFMGVDDDTKTRPDEVRVLCALAAQTRGNLLEIGTNRGRTTRALAKQSAPRLVYAVDFIPPVCESAMAREQVNEIPTMETVCLHARNLPNVHLSLLDSKTFDYAGKNIGFVFIDGNHTLEGVRADTELALAAMRDGQTAFPFIIAWHDYYDDRPVDSCFVRVRQYLDETFSEHWPVKHVTGTAVAYAEWPAAGGDEGGKAGAEWEWVLGPSSRVVA